MHRAFFILVGFCGSLPLLHGCGLDWTLPQAHFDGVDEHGYVAYWEEIGQADLDDGLVIPINIGFNSHRESSSSTLGKGWVVPLLESHLEPVDENTMNVLMPDGWTFTFLRNGNTETWRGNAGWLGETKDTVFTITAPCGWRIKYDGGKIQEIDSDKNHTLSVKYNGFAATEVDVDNKVFLQVEGEGSLGTVKDIIISGHKIDIFSDKRPRIELVGKQNLVTGFDPSLNKLRWPNGKTESFTFGTDKGLNPTLAIALPGQIQRNLTWDSVTRQIKRDGEWTYNLIPSDNVALNRTNTSGQSEFFSQNFSTGTIISQGIDGVKRITTTFVDAGVLNGKMRSVAEIKNGISKIVQRYDYDEKGRIVRQFLTYAKPHEYVFKYNVSNKVKEIDRDGQPYLRQEFDNLGRLISKSYSFGQTEKYSYSGSQTIETIIFKSGKTIKNYLPNVYAMSRLTTTIEMKASN